jgi:hypothetical protein
MMMLTVKTYSNFKPEIARKIKLCTICPVIQEVGVPSKKAVMIKVTFMKHGGGGVLHGKNNNIIPHLKFFGGN